MSKKISLFSLVLLIVAAIDSIRNMPSTAIFGSSLIFFFLFSALVFLIPISLISAEFSSRYSEEGGVFHWVRHAFGEKVAFFAIWLQWINTMVWYPTILAFIAGTAAYLFNPAWAQNKTFLVAVIVIFTAAIAELEFERETGNITTAEDALWWAITTITTVGYGDRYPTTIEGRLVAVGLMAVGVGLFGTLSGIAASWFTQANR
jgi:amino acid transporter